MKRFYIVIIASIAFIFILLSQLFWSKSSFINQLAIEKEISFYEQKIDSLRIVIEEQKHEIDRLKNDSLYKEEILRVKYGMTRKGENVFQMLK